MHRMEDFAKSLSLKVVLLILGITGLCVFFNSFFNGFVWDDEEQIVLNSTLHSLSNFPTLLSGSTFSTGGAPTLSGWFFRPLFTFSLMLLYQIGGANAWVYHLFQVCLHIFNSWLLFILLEKLINSAKQAKLKLINLFVCLLFLIHPAINEGITYISALSEVIFTTFNLSALLLIVSSGSKITFKLLFIVFFLLFLSPLTKESGITVVPIILSYLLIYKKSAWKKWSLITIGATVLYFVTRLLVIGKQIQHPQFAPITEATLWERLLTIPQTLAHYLLLTLYPDKLAVSQHFVVRTASLNQFWIPLLFDLFFLLALMWSYFRFREKVILFGLLWFLFGFSLISQVIPLDMTVAERWFYFPFMGLIIALAGILIQLKDYSYRFFEQLSLIACMILIVLSVRTVIRNSNWYDGLTLYSHDITVTHNSFDLENNLGVELFRTGKIDEAKPHFERSLELQPKWYFSRNNLGAVYQRQGQLELAKQQYEEVLKTSDYYLTYQNLAELKNKTESTESAKLFIEQTLRKLPNNPVLWFHLAIAEYRLGHQEQALKALENSYYLSPSEQTSAVYNYVKQGLPASGLAR